MVRWSCARTRPVTVSRRYQVSLQAGACCLSYRFRLVQWVRRLTD